MASSSMTLLSLSSAWFSSSRGSFARLTPLCCYRNGSKVVFDKTWEYLTSRPSKLLALPPHATAPDRTGSSPHRNAPCPPSRASHISKSKHSKESKQRTRRTFLVFLSISLHTSPAFFITSAGFIPSSAIFTRFSVIQRMYDERGFFGKFGSFDFLTCFCTLSNSPSDTAAFWCFGAISRFAATEAGMIWNTAPFARNNYNESGPSRESAET